MPADDRYDSPHDYTKRTAADPYGCRGPRAEGYWAQDGWVGNGAAGGCSPNFVWVDDVMSKTCNYDCWKIDPRCVGCTREKGN